MKYLYNYVILNLQLHIIQFFFAIQPKTISHLNSVQLGLKHL